MTRHWTHNDFAIVDEVHSGDYGAQHGYCRKCGADMQRFKESPDGQPVQWGSLKHYNSHKRSGFNVKPQKGEVRPQLVEIHLWDGYKSRIFIKGK